MKLRVAAAVACYAVAGVAGLGYFETPSFLAKTGVLPIIGGLIIWTSALTGITLTLARRQRRTKAS